MARYRGPKHKLSRRVGYDIWGGSKGPAARRPYPPGEHGAKTAGRRGGSKQSTYGKHLLEKQKLRHYYGMLEKQFRNLFHKASGMRGVTGDTFLGLLESRLDSVAYRSGIAPTIWAARQIVTHGHLRVNGQKVDCPSFQVKAGDVVSVREKSRNVAAIKDSLQDTSRGPVPPYLDVSAEAFEVRMVETPQARDIPVEVDVALIVEYYSR